MMPDPLRRSVPRPLLQIGKSLFLLALLKGASLLSAREAPIFGDLAASAPDGFTYAYVDGDSAGSWDLIIIGRQGRTSPKRISGAVLGKKAGLGEPTPESMAWSADSEFLAMQLSQTDEATTTLVVPRDGDETRLRVLQAGSGNGSCYPLWSRKGSKVFVIPCDAMNGAGKGGQGIHEFDMASGRHRQRMPDWFFLRLHDARNGLILANAVAAASKGAVGLVVVDLNQERATVLAKQRP